MKKEDVKFDSSFAGYIFGVISIVSAILTTYGIGGIIFGIIGLIQSKKQKDVLAKKARKLNLIGLVLGMVVLIISIIAIIILSKTQGLQLFPVQ